MCVLLLWASWGGGDEGGALGSFVPRYCGKLAAFVLLERSIMVEGVETLLTPEQTVLHPSFPSFHAVLMRPTLPATHLLFMDAFVTSRSLACRLHEAVHMLSSRFHFFGWRLGVCVALPGCGSRGHRRRRACHDNYVWRPS